MNAAIVDTEGDDDSNDGDNLLVWLLNVVHEHIDEELTEQIEYIVKDKVESKLNNLDAALSCVNELEQKAE